MNRQFWRDFRREWNGDAPSAVPGLRCGVGGRDWAIWRFGIVQWPPANFKGGNMMFHYVRALLVPIDLVVRLRNQTSGRIENWKFRAETRRIGRLRKADAL